MYRQIWALPTNYWKESYVFDAKIWKFGLARFAHSRKLPWCKNIVKKCDDNNCGASRRKPYNVGETIFFFLADLNSPDSMLQIDIQFANYLPPPPPPPKKKKWWKAWNSASRVYFSKWPYWPNDSVTPSHEAVPRKPWYDNSSRNWGGTWLSRGSYGVYVAITKCTRLLRGVRGNIALRGGRGHIDVEYRFGQICYLGLVFNSGCSRPEPAERNRRPPPPHPILIDYVFSFFVVSKCFKIRQPLSAT